MWSRSRTLCLAALAAIACRDARTIVAESGDIAIADAYATASAAPEMSSVYFTVLNRGTVVDTVMAVQSGARAELHAMAMEDGLSTMRPAAALPVPGGSCITLKPGSYHVMLSELPTPLAAGDSIDVRVVMARAQAIDMRLPVLTYTDVVARLDAAGEGCP